MDVVSRFFEIRIVIRDDSHVSYYYNVFFYKLGYQVLLAQSLINLQKHVFCGTGNRAREKKMKRKPRGKGNYSF